MNKFIIIGRVSNPIEENGKVATISIAVKRDFKEKDGSYGTDFFNVKVFGKAIDVLKNYTNVGDTLMIECSVRNNNWESKNGEKHRDQDFILNNFEFVSKSSKAEKSSQPKEEQQVVEQPKQYKELNDDELPF